MSDETYRTSAGATVDVSRAQTSRVHAVFGDMRAASTLLRTVAGRLIDHQLRVLNIEAQLPHTADFLSPTTAWPCAEHVLCLTVGSQALGLRAASAFSFSNLLMASVALYETAESIADAQVARVQQTVALVRLGLAVGYGLEQFRRTGDAGEALTDALDKVPGAAAGGPALVNLVGGGAGYEMLTGALGSLGDDEAKHAGPVRVTQSHGPGDHQEPPASSVGDSARRINALHGNGSQAAHIQAQRVVDSTGHGRWVVLVPGTQDFSGNRPNPADGTGNLQSVAGHPSAMSGAVVSALRQAQQAEGVFGKGEPVMVVGHSQGGMVASNLARDPAATRSFNITKVATFGAPVGQFTPGTDELDVVNSRDVVPAMSGAENDDPRRTRVVIDDPRSMTNSDGHREATGAHDSKNYGSNYTAALLASSPDSALRRFDDSTTPFFAGHARTYVYDAHRTVSTGHQ